MSQAGPALRCLLDEATHRDAGTFMKAAAMAAEGRAGPPGTIAWALSYMSQLLWAAPVDAKAALAFRRAIWHPVLDLLAHSAEGTAGEARATLIAVWLLGHPSSSASPIPQLLNAHIDGSDGSSTSYSSSSSSTLCNAQTSTLTPRPMVLAVIRSLSAFLRISTGACSSAWKASAQQVFSYARKSQNNSGDGGAGGSSSGLTSQARKSSLGELNTAAVEMLSAKSTDGSGADSLPGLVLPTSAPLQPSSTSTPRPPLITEVKKDDTDSSTLGGKQMKSVASGDIQVKTSTQERLEEGMPPSVVTAFARTPMTIQSLVSVAIAMPPSTSTASSSPSTTSSTSFQRHDSSSGPTVLSSGASQCALRAAVALAFISSQKPSKDAESSSGRSGGSHGGVGAADNASISSLSSTFTEEEQSEEEVDSRRLATEALWSALPALGQLLHVLRRWVGHPEPSRKRPWALALDDLLKEWREILEIAEFEDRSRIAAAAARRDGREDGKKEVALAEEAHALGAAGRSRLVWLITAVFPALIEEEGSNRSSRESLESIFSGSSSSSSKRRSSKSKTVSSSSRIVQALQNAVGSISNMDPMSPHWRIPRDSIIARAGLQKLCIALGMIKDTKLNECLAASNSHLLIEIQGAATRLLHDKSPGQSAAIHVLATAALQRVYSSPSGPLNNSDAHNSEVLALSLLDLLDFTQGASATATATLVAASAATRPAVVLPRLFEKLSPTHKTSASKGDSLKRKNALLVVKELFALCPEVRGLESQPIEENTPIEAMSTHQPPSASSSAAGLLQASGTAVATGATGAQMLLNDNANSITDDTASAASSVGNTSAATSTASVLRTTSRSGPSLARELGARLLDHLDDEDLELRTFAGSLVALLPPELSVPKLLKAMLPDDENLENSDERETVGIGDSEFMLKVNGEEEEEEEHGQPVSMGLKPRSIDMSSGASRLEQDKHARRRAAAEEALRLAVVGPASDTAGAIRAILDAFAYDAPSATTTTTNQLDKNVNAIKAMRSRIRDNLLPRWLTSLQKEDSALLLSSSSLPRATRRSEDGKTTSMSSIAPIVGMKWKDALLAVARRVLAAPDDPTAVGLMAKLASRSAVGHGEAFLIGEVALDAMTGQACLSEEILAGKSTAVQQLLFARLAPLLLLKTVPAQSWLHDGSKDQKIWKQDFHQLLVSKIASEVTQRAMQLYEFDEVRRLAAEVLGRLPPCFLAPTLANALLSTLGIPSTLIETFDSTTPSSAATMKEIDYEPVPVASQAKAVVFALCHAIAAHGSQLPFLATFNTATEDAASNEAEEIAVKENEKQLLRLDVRAERWMAQIVAHLFAVLLLPDRGHARNTQQQPSELSKLQRGCIDALSFFFQVPFAEAAETENERKGESEGTVENDSIHSGPKSLKNPLIEEIPDKLPLPEGRVSPPSQVIDTKVPPPAPPVKLPSSSQAAYADNKRAYDATPRRDDDTSRSGRQEHSALMVAAGDWIATLLSTGELPPIVLKTLSAVTQNQKKNALPQNVDFYDGARVMLHSLVAKPELNESMGTVVVEASGNKKSKLNDHSRCAVRLDSTSRMLSLAKNHLTLLESSGNVASSSITSAGNVADAGAAADDDATNVSALPDSSLRALRICAANALISAFQRADPALILPRLLKAALPALLKVAQSKEAPSKSIDKKKHMGDGMSSTLRAASFQGLFVGIFRLPFPSYNSGSSDGRSSVVACPPLARSLLLHTPCVVSLLNAALSAIEPPPLVSAISEASDPLETSPNASKNHFVDKESSLSSTEVTCSALKLLMALVARAPRLFEPTAIDNRNNSGTQRSESLVRAVTLPSLPASSLLNSSSSPSDQAHAEEIFFAGYPELNGPQMLMKCRAAVRQCAMRWHDPLVKQLAAQILEAIG